MDFYRNGRFLPVYQYGQLHLMPNPVFTKKYGVSVISNVVDPIQSLSGNVLGGGCGGARRKSGSIAAKLRSALNQFNRPHFNRQSGGRRRIGRGIGII